MCRWTPSVAWRGWSAGPTARQLIVAAMNGSVEEDLARRDFTIDAMALPIEVCCQRRLDACHHRPLRRAGRLGARGLVRMVNDRVLREDPSRLLRGACVWPVASASASTRKPRSAIADHAHLIDTIAKERIRDEFLTLLSLDAPQDTLHCLDDSGAVVPHCPGVGAGAGGKSA